MLNGEAVAEPLGAVQTVVVAQIVPQATMAEVLFSAQVVEVAADRALYVQPMLRATAVQAEHGGLTRLAEVVLAVMD